MFSKIIQVSRASLKVLPSFKPLMSSARPLSTMALFKFGSIEKVDKVKTKLQKAIQKELKYEEENYQKDDTVASTLKETGFNLKDSENDNTIELVKKVGNTTVLISFQSRPPPMNENEGEEGAEQKKEGEEDQDFQDYCEFTVYIISNKGNALAFDCASNDSEININSITKVEDVESHKKISRYERIGSGYNGPDFATLDERLQTSMLEYLRSHGVTEEVAAIVEHLSLDKEQRLYMNWLKDLEDFIGKN